MIKSIKLALIGLVPLSVFMFIVYILFLYPVIGTIFLIAICITIVFILCSIIGEIILLLDFSIFKRLKNKVNK